MERFVCVNGSDNLQIPEKLLHELNITDPEQIHLSAGNLVRAASNLEKAGWVRLPLCNTLLGEALGASPTLTLSGARIRENPWARVEELPAVPDFSTPRMAAMLHAVEMLAEEGYRVAYNIEGPFALLCALLPMSRVFSALRKPAGAEMLEKVEDWVCKYAAAAVEKGAKLISFADPVATVDILGERVFTTAYVPSLRRVLRRIRAEHPEVLIHLCGKLTQSLLDTGCCAVRHWECSDPSAVYGQALQAFAAEGQQEILGHFCLNFLDAKRPYVKVLEL